MCNIDCAKTLDENSCPGRLSQLLCFKNGYFKPKHRHRDEKTGKFTRSLTKEMIPDGY